MSPPGGGHQTLWELCSHPSSKHGARCPCCSRSSGSGARMGSMEALGAELGTGDAAGAFFPPEINKSKRETRVSLLTCFWVSTHTTACSPAFLYLHTHIRISARFIQKNIHTFPIFLFFFPLGRRLQRSRRSGCCHGNSRCRNSFGLSLGNPSWSCQAIGSRGGM